MKIGIYDLDLIRKEIKKLKMPKEFENRVVNLEALFSHDYAIQLSIRKDAGKTTQALIVGMILFKLYGFTTEYLRCDKVQLTRKDTETIYDVILKYDYVSKLFNDKYNTVVYHPMVKKFYLGYQDADGNIISEMDVPLCVLHSNEEWKRFKSSYNNPMGNFIVFDEMMDSERSTTNQMLELQNNISTIGRERPDCHALLLGNNTNQYSFWFEEFCIEKEIPALNFGSYIDKTTELGTTVYCELLEVSAEKKEQIKQRKIRFSGFNTPKMNAFNGLNAWQGSSWQHIYDDGMFTGKVLDNIFIRHRNRYIRVNLYINEEYGKYAFLHYFNKPTKDDAIILTLNPAKDNEFFGICQNEESNKRVAARVQDVFQLLYNNRFYYSTNSVGDLFSDYLLSQGLKTPKIL